MVAVKNSAGGDSPAITQLAQLHEHGACIRQLLEVGKRLAQPRDDARILQPEEAVDELLLSDARHRCRGRIVMPRGAEQRLGILVARFAIEGELEISRQVFVPRVDTGARGQPR